MGSDFKNQILEKYQGYIPEVAEVPCLDLKKEQIVFDQKRPPWGIIDFFSRRVTFGGKYIGLCVINNKEIEDYPVGFCRYDESFSSEVTKIFASSIKTWLPCYLVYYLNDLLTNIWSESLREAPIYKISLTKLDEILKNKERLIELLKKFNNVEFLSIMETIFKVVEEKETENHPDWDYVKFYKIADGNGSYVAKFLEMKKNGASEDEWLSLIKKYPFYNEPLKYLFSWENKTKISNVELAKEYYWRKIFLCSLSTDYIKPARFIYKNAKNDPYDFGGIVEILIKQGVKNDQIALEYFKAGEVFEKANDFNKAINCFENSIYFNSLDINFEDFNYKAFDKLLDISTKINDKNYLSYLSDIGELMPKPVEAQNKRSFEEDFGKYIPELKSMGGMDLNWDHDLHSGDPAIFPNFGMKSLYSIGGTGHDHLVYFIVPGVAPENYPIAEYSEEKGRGKIISSSVKKWLPSFLVNRVNELLCWSW